MLDLQPRVHLHEVEATLLIGDELHRARAGIVHRARRGDRRFAHLPAARLGHARCRRFFQHLLMPPLHGAVALEEIHAVAVVVREHLDLDMARTQHVFFDQHPIVAKTRCRFALARSQRLREVLRGVDDAHALAATAGGGFDQQGIANPIGLR